METLVIGMNSFETVLSVGGYLFIVVFAIVLTLLKIGSMSKAEIKAYNSINYPPKIGDHLLWSIYTDDRSPIVRIQHKSYEKLYHLENGCKFTLDEIKELNNDFFVYNNGEMSKI